MPETPHPQQTSDINYQAHLDRVGLGDLALKLGISLEANPSPQLLLGRMPVEGNTQPIGLLHGGASAALAETLGSFAAYLHAIQYDKVAVGVDLSISHLSPARSGQVIGTCRAIKLGRTTCVHSIDIKDEAGRLISTARITNMLMPRPQ